MKGTLILDTNFIVALFSNSDTLHKRAFELAPKLIDFETIINHYIYLECATLLSQKIGKQFNLEKQLNKLEIKLKFVPDSLFLESIKEFKTQSNKNISFIDLLTALYIEKNKLCGIITFDKHFEALGKKFGFKVISE